MAAAEFPADAQQPPSRINLAIVEGEGAINNVNRRADRDPAIRVEDENGKPVVGAAVVFTLPSDGSSGEFGNGSRNLTVVTDEQGRAVAQGLKANNVPGTLQIHVNASYRGLTARTNITQFNMAVPGRSKVSKNSSASKKWLIILAIAGAGAAGGVLALNNGNSSSPASAPAAIVINPGSGSIGPPK
jgi:hypothetical protein